MDMTGWTKYDGTGQPVPDETVVEIFFRWESVGICSSTPERADHYDWYWYGVDGDILYYKVVD